MEVKVQIEDYLGPIKVYLGTVATAISSAWVWLGNNHDSLATLFLLVSFVYTTVAFVQHQLDRNKNGKYHK